MMELSDSITTANLANQKNLKTRNRGSAFIFNYNAFDCEENEKYGNIQDVEKLRKTFESLNFHITSYPKINLQDIKKKIQETRIKDYSTNFCFVVVLLFQSCEMEKFYIFDILNPILENKTLNGIPKCFIIQSRKGFIQFKSPNEKFDKLPYEIIICNNIIYDSKIYQSKNGSVFIQSLCELIKTDGNSLQIEKIIRKIQAKIKESIGNNQLLSYTSTLTEPFILGSAIKLRTKPVLINTKTN